jgi:hypothetical protein
VYSGGWVGNVIALQSSGILAATTTGWSSCFYFWGVVSLTWAIAWNFLGKESPAEHPSIAPDEQRYIESSLGIVETTEVNNVLLIMYPNLFAPQSSMFSSLRPAFSYHQFILSIAFHAFHAFHELLSSCIQHQCWATRLLLLVYARLSLLVVPIHCLYCNTRIIHTSKLLMIILILIPMADVQLHQLFILTLISNFISYYIITIACNNKLLHSFFFFFFLLSKYQTTIKALYREAKVQ